MSIIIMSTRISYNVVDKRVSQTSELATNLNLDISIANKNTTTYLIN
jgi:hypothetical protein